jgi:hypothetical protein
MNRISLLFGGLLLAVTGCRTMGDTGVVDAGEELRLLNFEVRDGTTTREDLLLQLGAPTSDFEKGHLTVHRLFIGSGGRLLPITCLTNEPIQVDRRLYDLVLVFDNAVVTRHSLVKIR